LYAAYRRCTLAAAFGGSLGPRPASPSSRGPGHRPFTAVTRVRISLGTPIMRGRRVAIIGGGSSAIDLAALMHEAGVDVQVVARRETIQFHAPPVEPRALLDRMRNPRSGLRLGWRSRLCTDAPLLFHTLPQKFRLRVVKRHLGPAPGMVHAGENYGSCAAVPRRGHQGTKGYRQPGQPCDHSVTWQERRTTS
jgi:hypothetical protein